MANAINLGKVMGSRMLFVTSPPSPGTGLQDDWAFDTASGKVWQKTSAGWVYRGNIKEGNILSINGLVADEEGKLSIGAADVGAMSTSYMAVFNTFFENAELAKKLYTLTATATKKTVVHIDVVAKTFKDTTSVVQVTIEKNGEIILQSANIGGGRFDYGDICSPSVTTTLEAGETVRMTLSEDRSSGATSDSKLQNAVSAWASETISWIFA